MKVFYDGQIVVGQKLRGVGLRQGLEGILAEEQNTVSVRVPNIGYAHLLAPEGIRMIQTVHHHRNPP